MDSRLKLVSGILTIAVLFTFFFVACDKKTEEPHVVTPSDTVETTEPSQGKKTETTNNVGPGTIIITMPDPTAPVITTETETATASVTDPVTETTSQPTETKKPTATKKTTTGTKFSMTTVTRSEIDVQSGGPEDQFYNDSVFVGNSIMLGFSNYAKKTRNSEETKGYLGSAKFFCGGSFGVYNNARPIKEDSTHPEYQGKKYTVEDAIGVMGSKTVYLNLMGLNDLAMYGDPDNCSVKCAQDMAKLMENIHSRYPDVKIVVLSATYLTKDRYYASLNNRNLSLLNAELLKYCNEKGYDFVDIASAMLGSDGFMKNEYSSDDYCHLNKKGYKVWTDTLYAYARESTAGSYKNPSEMKTLPAKP
ncbi:MAG: SGNH/GDSL hydrolase family protein [Clostridia bacterium]|nr:SGNH/GDSL hydrolase family protein [Clostridia bacterium]